MNPIEDIQRIIYWWRRYMGKRVEGGKSYSFSDVDVLEKRINQYLKTPSKFNFDYPDMNIDEFGFLKQSETEKGK